MVAVQRDSCWVETIQQSTCDACAARHGCGQRLLSRLGGRANRIRVLRNDRVAADIRVGDQVTIGIAEQVLVKGAALVYLLPLCGLVAGATAGQLLLQAEWVAIVFGLAGLGLGGLLVRTHARLTRNDPRLCPVILDHRQPAN